MYYLHVWSLDAAALRKLATHPSTAIMVKEALKELDSRKGVSSQAIQNYIKQKYPSVDLVRLKHFVRKALKKGIETGTLVRPANSNTATGAMGKFRVRCQVCSFTKAGQISSLIGPVMSSVFSLHRKSRRPSQKLRTWIPMCEKHPKQPRMEPRSPKKQV